MDGFDYLEYLGDEVVIEVADGVMIGVVLSVSRTSETIVLQPYRLPDGINVTEALDFGDDLHLTPRDERRDVAMSSIVKLERVNVQTIAPSQFKRSTIDALGDRLKCGNIHGKDLRLLDAWRREYRPAYRLTVSALQQSFQFNPSGRPAKTTGAIREKLLRQSVRLSQMQDIAGCRIIVPLLSDQDAAVSQITSVFDKRFIFDRRANPSYGYRAVHIVAQVEGRPVEIQVRTEMQHFWADLSQKFADTYSKDVKYGAGPKDLIRGLADLSALIQNAEESKKFAGFKERAMAIIGPLIMMT